MNRDDASKKGGSYDPQLVQFLLSEDFSRLKRLNLAFKALVFQRYQLILAFNDFEERLVQGLLKGKGLEETLAQLQGQGEELLLLLNDLAPGRFLWLLALFRHMAQALREEASWGPSPVPIPLREIDLSRVSEVGLQAARLGEVRNLLKMPVPEAWVFPSWPNELEIQTLFSASQKIGLLWSPFKDWPFRPPRLEALPDERQILGAFQAQIRAQANLWKDSALSPSLDGALLVYALPELKKRGLLCPACPVLGEGPVFLLWENQRYQRYLLEEVPLSFTLSSLILRYAETISAHFQGPYVIEWGLTKDETILILDLFPYSHKDALTWTSPVQARKRHALPAASTVDFLARSAPERLKIWQKIVPFTMTLPESEDLAVVSKPSDFNTWQDIFTFAHEAAVREMFRLTGEGLLHLLKDSRLPVHFFLLDLGQGLRKQAAFRREISIADVRSRPLKALWQGMTHEGVSWKGPVEFNLGGFFSVLSRSFVEGRVTKEGGKGYLLVTEDYLYLRLRLAYHLMVVEAFFREGEEGFLLFRLQGGGAGASGRTQRFLLLKEILEALGFRVEIAGDLIQGLFLSGEEGPLVEHLDQLGRLLAFTRQLDMTLADEETRRRYVEAFLKGYYSVLSEPPPEEKG